MKEKLICLAVKTRNLCCFSIASFSQSEIEAKVAENSSGRLPITLLLDNIRGPDNLGAILRVAAAIGVKKILAMRGCADAWQSKCLRAAAGAHFSLPIVTNLAWEDVNRHLPNYPQASKT